MQRTEKFVESYKKTKIIVEPYMKNQFRWRVEGQKKTGIATTVENAFVQAKRYIDKKNRNTDFSKNKIKT